jgi:protein toll
MNIFSASEDEFCVDPVQRAMAISLSTVLSVVAALLCCILFAYRQRVMLFTRWHFHPFDRDECVGENMLYDVFLCCSSEDDQPHGRQILQQLEMKGYRVCYHLRDFTAGELINNNIVLAVQSSKRTVCLLTPHFIQSVYCQREFDVALHHNVTIKRKNRIVVLMAMSSDANNVSMDSATDSLRQYLSQYTYIDYTARNWFDRLLYTLPLNGLNRQQTDDEDTVLLSADADENSDAGDAVNDDVMLDY